MELRRWGALAAPVLALVYVAGIALNFSLLDASGIADPLERVRHLVEHQGAMSTFILVLYTFFGCLVPVVALALHDRLAPGARPLVDLATVFALVWSALLIGSGLVYGNGLAAVAKLLPLDPEAAVQLWRAVETIHEGLGCMVELPGGLWILLTGAAIRRSGIFPRACGGMSMVVGTAGILTVIPTFFVPAAGLFALGGILWFSRMGYLLSGRRSPAPSLLAESLPSRDRNLP